MEEQTKEKHWSDGLVIDWSDTRYRKYLHTVKIVEEGWFYTKIKHDGKLWKRRDNYYIVSATKNTASTNGTTGFCTCEAFKTKEPNEAGNKIPCKHLWKCKELMDAWIKSHNEYMHEYMADDREKKNQAVCDHLKSAKDDPNSLFSDLDFVEEFTRKGD